MNSCHKHSEEEQATMAILQAKYHIASVHASAAYELVKNNSVDKAPCKETALAYLYETFYCCYHQSIFDLSAAKNIQLVLDGSGKQFSRQFLCISFVADFKTGREKRTYALYEFVTGGAPNIINLVIQVVSYIHEVQQKHNLTPMYLNNIKGLTLDNCSENMGPKNGVAALLEQYRELEWRKRNGNAKYIPLVVKGCDDHKANIISTHYDQRLTKRELSWGRHSAIGKGGVHLATVVIKGVIGK